MKIFQFGKIIREGFLDKLLKYGGGYEKVDLSPEDSILELKKKLVEETEEVVSATSPQDLLEEISDVMEVVDSLLKAINVSPEELQEIRDIKYKLRGGLRISEKIITVSIPEKSEELRPHLIYLQENTDRYPEVSEHSSFMKER